MKWILYFSTTNIFGYNTRSELTSAQMDTNMFAYLYDDIGNRKEASANAVLTYYEANELNQYMEIEHITPISPSYDADGNITNDTEWGYTWDAENRLINARRQQPMPRRWNVSYVYDYMGRLIRRSFSFGPPSASTEVNEYMYDGWNRIRSRHWDGRSEATSTVTTNYWVWGLDLSGTLQGAGGVGGLLAEIKPNAGTVRYPFYDGNGNITDWMDADATLVAHHEYDPYGNETTGNPPASFGFSTKPLDATLGLYYYGYRFYRPEWGRWINRDPIEERGGINLYSFVENSPQVKYDILGLKCGDWKDVGTPYLKYTGMDVYETVKRCSYSRYQLQERECKCDDGPTTREVLLSGGRSCWTPKVYNCPSGSYFELVKPPPSGQCP